jgi:drug/metabolite transporter (DMT)-like permease
LLPLSRLQNSNFQQASILRRSQPALARKALYVSAQKLSDRPATRQSAPQKAQQAAKGQGDDEPGGSNNFALVASIVAALGTGLANRVLYKMALVPMGDYVFVLSQFQTFGYCLVYFSFLAARYRSGAVTKEMFAATDKRIFVGIGALEAASQLLGFVGASKLPGVTLPLLQQSIIPFNILLSFLVLQRPLDAAQIIGALVVVAGVCTAALPSEAGSGIFQQADPMYIAIFVSSMFFPALASIFKEKIFREAKEKLNGKDLDIFVVNSLGSAAQAAFVFLLLPVLASQRGLSLSDLPQYVGDGLSCFRGVTPGGGSGCDGAPLLPVAYVGFNLAYNIALLNLLRNAGAIVQSLTNSSLTPLTIYAFTFSLPYLPSSPELGPNFLLGSSLLVGGLLTYNFPKRRPLIDKKRNGE